MYTGNGYTQESFLSAACWFVVAVRSRGIVVDEVRSE